MSSDVEMPLVSTPPASGPNKPGPAPNWPGWPTVQPNMPRSATYFLCPALFLALVLIPLYYLGVTIGMIILCVLVAILSVACCCPITFVLTYFSNWSWIGDLYTKTLFLAYQTILMNRVTPTTSPKFMPIDGIRPKGPLERLHVDYALNLRVPIGFEEEFSGDAISLDYVSARVEESFAALPQREYLEAFLPGEDPVAYMMGYLGSVYPIVYQDWTDKLSDQALARFCLYGLAAHRIEVTVLDGKKAYVVKTNQLSSLEVRPGFARYGGDAYFDEGWNPIQIVDNGINQFRFDGSVVPVVVRPGDANWEHEKFRFRSSLSVLVTLVDHLYGVHLQVSNSMVTSIRERLSADHPLRRFLTPFTFQTISVNDNARNNLIQPKTMASRCFGFTGHAMQLAFAAAPGMLMSGLEVSVEDGGPILNRAKYIDYLKSKGIDTEYYRQSKRYALIIEAFVESYLAFYYKDHAAVMADTEIMEFFLQYTQELSIVTPERATGGTRRLLQTLRQGDSMSSDMAEGVYQYLKDILVNFIFLVTAGHEQVGAVEAYVQDVSFCSFKWVPGASVGTKQTALAQGLLMSFTSTPMPKLLGSDWTHLFPPGPSPPTGAKSAAQCFNDFQAALVAFSQYCDEYDAQAPQRQFPENFPMYVLNPKRLETSISV